MARKSILAVVVSLLAIVAVGLWAQTRRDPAALTAVPDVLSGENVGVRVTSLPDKTGKVTGTLVVKINGQWVDVASSPTLIPVK